MASDRDRDATLGQSSAVAVPSHDTVSVRRPRALVPRFDAVPAKQVTVQNPILIDSNARTEVRSTIPVTHFFRTFTYIRIPRSQAFVSGWAQK